MEKWHHNAPLVGLGAKSRSSHSWAPYTTEIWPSVAESGLKRPRCKAGPPLGTQSLGSQDERSDAASHSCTVCLPHLHVLLPLGARQSVPIRPRPPCTLPGRHHRGSTNPTGRRRRRARLDRSPFLCRPHARSDEWEAGVTPAPQPEALW